MTTVISPNSQRHVIQCPLVLLTLLALALSGCVGDSAPPIQKASGVSKAAAPSTLGPLMRPHERERVEEAYRRFWAVSVEVDKQPPSRWREALAGVATEPMLGTLLQGFAAQRAKGELQFGSVVPRPTVVELTAQRASIVDCQDASGSGELDIESGEPKRIGSARTPVAAVLRRVDGDGWRVAQARYLDGSC